MNMYIYTPNNNSNNNNNVYLLSICYVRGTVLKHFVCTVSTHFPCLLLKEAENSYHPYFTNKKTVSRMLSKLPKGTKERIATEWETD